MYGFLLKRQYTFGICSAILPRKTISMFSCLLFIHIDPFFFFFFANIDPSEKGSTLNGKKRTNSFLLE